MVSGRRGRIASNRLDGGGLLLPVKLRKRFQSLGSRLDPSESRGLNKFRYRTAEVPYEEVGNATRAVCSNEKCIPDYAGAFVVIERVRSNMFGHEGRSSPECSIWHAARILREEFPTCDSIVEHRNSKSDWPRVLRGNSSLKGNGCCIIGAHAVSANSIQLQRRSSTSSTATSGSISKAKASVVRCTPVAGVPARSWSERTAHTKDSKRHARKSLAERSTTPAGVQRELIYLCWDSAQRREHEGGSAFSAPVVRSTERGFSIGNFSNVAEGISEVQRGAIFDVHSKLARITRLCARCMRPRAPKMGRFLSPAKSAGACVRRRVGENADGLPPSAHATSARWPGEPEMMPAARSGGVGLNYRDVVVPLRDCARAAAPRAALRRIELYRALQIRIAKGQTTKRMTCVRGRHALELMNDKGMAK